MAKTPLGQFVWHELVTTDVAGARAFYGAVAGLESTPWDKDPSYVLWMAPSGPVGGCMALPAPGQTGTTPHWLSYLGTPSVDDSAAKAKQLGAQVLHGPTDIPGAGRYAVVSDPSGAVFCLYTATDKRPASDGAPRLGEFSWHDLASPIADGAWTFYGSLFGWEGAGEVPIGPGRVYREFAANGRTLGGIYPETEGGPPPAWIPYLKVASAEEAVDRAKSLGGTVVYGPMEVPGGDRMAMLRDPQGAWFAVHASKA